MEEASSELCVSEADALGADFITVELDETQPIEYVVKWAEVGSKFTIQCVKTEPNANSAMGLTLEPDQSFYQTYEEEVYPCEVTETSVEIKTDSDDENQEEEEEEEHEIEGREEDEETDEEEDLEDQHDVGGGHLEDLDDSDFDPNEHLLHPHHHHQSFRCSVCGRSYSHASSLYRHQQTHGPNAKANANAAAAAAQASSALTQQQKRTAQLDATQETHRYTCPHCGMSFKGSRMLGSHLRLHGKRRIHPCNICGKEFNHSSSLSRHRLVHKKGAGHNALLKGGAGSHGALLKGGGGGGGGTNSLLKGGMDRRGSNMAALRHSLKPRARSRKGKRGSGQGLGGGHLGAGERFFACPQCEMSFRTSTALSKHQVSHVKQLLDSYTPGKENLSESSDLKIRLKLCSRDKPNFYTLCNRGNKRKNKNNNSNNKRRRGQRGVNNNNNNNSNNSSDTPRQHGCSQCGKRFSHASSLARHSLTHRHTHTHTGAGAADAHTHSHAHGMAHTHIEDAEIIAMTTSSSSSSSKQQQQHNGGAGGRRQSKNKNGGKNKTFTCLACDKTFMHSSSFSRHKKAHMEAELRANAAANSASVSGGGEANVIINKRRRNQEVLDETAPLESDSE